jgi:hypothetical protein
MMNDQQAEKTALHEIGFAYATSDTAKKLKCADTGCYYYRCGELLKAFETEGEARKFALSKSSNPQRFSLDHPLGAKIV